MRPKKQFASQASKASVFCPTTKKGVTVTATALLCLVMAGCSSAPSDKKVKFSSEKYGVPASPKVVAEGQPVPKGGGRSFVGKPYKVAGKWYKPRHDPDYEKVGFASWYGPTFHGRMTANGEVFDRDALTAAHTTMPLPSYARVTNLENGRSVTVRVNDRGPFHGNREIDLSERVATLLDYKHKGVAKVKVEYVGPARMDGQDEEFLLASYSGPGSTVPGATQPGTLLAQATPPAEFDGSVPVPQSRPYEVFATLASAAGSSGDTYRLAYDPALAFEARADAIRVASAGRLAEGSESWPTTGLSSPDATVPDTPRIDHDTAVSSFAANTRIRAAYSAISDMQGGIPLSKLALKAGN